MIINLFHVIGLYSEGEMAQKKVNDDDDDDDDDDD